MSEFSPNITPLFTVANQILANFFKVEKATNYISHIIEDRDTGDEYIITMQRISGETPLHQLANANDRIAHLEHALAQALELSLRDSEHFGGKRTDIAARIKESLNPAAIAGSDGDDYSDSPSTPVSGNKD